jgi:hypothetical protein
MGSKQTYQHKYTNNHELGTDNCIRRKHLLLIGFKATFVYFVGRAELIKFISPIARYILRVIVYIQAARQSTTIRECTLFSIFNLL